MKTMLVLGRWVVPDADAAPIENGAVLVEGDRVVAVGPAAELRSRATGATILGSPHHLVLPGFVNSHSHGRGLTGFQLGVTDDQLELWILDRRAQRPVDAYWDTALAALNMLTSGVTCVLHNQVTRNPTSYEAELDLTFAALQDAGLRVAFAPDLRWRHHFVYDEDRTFVATLPPALQADLTRYLASLDPVRLERYLRAFDGLVQRLGLAGARHRLLHGPISLQWIGDDDMRVLARRAAEEGSGLHVHVQESPYQKELGPRAYGHSIVERLERLGALGPRTTLGHAVWLSDGDIERLARTGTAYSHNPSANLRLKSGISPVLRARARGVTVGLGTDSMTINDDDDFVQEMRLAAKLHRPPGMDEADLSPRDVLEMATRNGRATTLFDDIGALHPGMVADMVLFRLDGILDESLQEPGFDPVELILYRGRREDVDLVLVGGEVVVEDGRATRMARERVIGELRADAERANASYRETRRLMRAVKPYVRQYYDQWFRDRGTPHYHVNSRR